MTASDGHSPAALSSARRRLLRVLLVLAVVGVATFLFAQYSLLEDSQYLQQQQVEKERARRYAINDGSAKKPKKPRKTKKEKKDSPPNQLSPEDDDVSKPEVTQETTPVPTTEPPHSTRPPRNFTAVSESEQEARRLAVRSAMQFAWENYQQRALTSDQETQRSWASTSTLVSAMDTLWVMRLTDEFSRARNFVDVNMSIAELSQSGNPIMVFDAMTKVVGGLLGSYELTGDDLFKTKAQELMNLLVLAYNEQSGVFSALYNPKTNERMDQVGMGKRAFIAELGSLQLELRYLSDVTGDAKFARMGDTFHMIAEREGSYRQSGLFPVHYDSESGTFGGKSKLSLGTSGDAFYEYLLKTFVYSGQRKEDAHLRALYDDAVEGIETYLTVYSKEDDLFFVQEVSVPKNKRVRRMDHLVCSIAGVLAFGTLFEKADPDKNAAHLELAKKIMETCYEMYHQQPTGLAPEAVSFPSLSVRENQHRLRSEAIESLFYLYRVTKDSRYREYGWDIFQAIEKHARTSSGYGTVLDVSQVSAQIEDKMEGFFLTETLKFHYLLQGPEHVLPLDEYVFSSEAHPFRIRPKKVA